MARLREGQEVAQFGLRACFGLPVEIRSPPLPVLRRCRVCVAAEPQCMPEQQGRGLFPSYRDIDAVAKTTY